MNFIARFKLQKFYGCQCNFCFWDPTRDEQQQLIISSLESCGLARKSVPVLNTCRSLYYNTDQKRIPNRGVKGRPTMRSTRLPCTPRSGNLGSHVQVSSTKWYITASFPESLMRKILPLWYALNYNRWTFLLMTPSLVFCCFEVELVLTTLEFSCKHNNHEYVFNA
jgi:hypothetical protein